MTLYFRIEDYRTAGACDEFGDPIPGSGSPAFRLRTFVVQKTTPKGVWLKAAYGDFATGDAPRFVLASATKKFACPSIEEAFQSWLARKAAEKRIYMARVKHVDDALNKISSSLKQWKAQYP